MVHEIPTHLTENCFSLSLLLNHFLLFVSNHLFITFCCFSGKTWFTGGCFTGQECMKYELTDPNIRCCEGDLCNEWSGDPEEMWLDGGGAHHTNDVINHLISCLIYKSHPISINVILSDHHLHNKNHIQWYIRVALFIPNQYSYQISVIL